MIGGVEHTITFLRMAAIEMRRLAELGSWAPTDSAKLRHIAEQCDTEADELSSNIASADRAEQRTLTLLAGTPHRPSVAAGAGLSRR